MRQPTLIFDPGCYFVGLMSCLVSWIEFGLGLASTRWSWIIGLCTFEISVWECEASKKKRQVKFKEKKKKATDYFFHLVIKSGDLVK